MEISKELQERLGRLTIKQQNAIVTVVQAEAERVPLTRLLKSSYSCRWCGRTIGAAGETAKQRRAKLDTHEKECNYMHPEPWHFICDSSTWYGEWLPNDDFSQALALARDEVQRLALSEAARLLRAGTSQAVLALLEVIATGQRDADRIRAAIALLDRADISTAEKRDDRLVELLRGLKEAEEE